MKRRVIIIKANREFRVVRGSSNVMMNQDFELHTDLIEMNISDAMTCVHVTEPKYKNVLNKTNVATYW